jgi:DNA-binding transcriptional LysR family regulator
VRLGEQVAKDMIALRIGPDMRMAVVGSPSYFKGRTRPQTPQDLTAHSCINMRLPTYGGLFPWEFEKDGREIKVRVEGQLVFNNISLRLESALAGLGLVFVSAGGSGSELHQG